MLFQSLDDKSQCVGVYCDGQLIFDEKNFPTDLSMTWKYAPSMKNREGIEYVNLYVEGKSIKEVAPEYLQDDWDDVSKRMRAFLRSLKIAKVNQEDHCVYDLAPSRLLMDFCEVKNTITKYVVTNVDRPDRYGFYFKVCEMLEDIASVPLNIDYRRLNTFVEDPKCSSMAKKILNNTPCVRYNQFGTKTGRLTTQESSFPILTLKKEMRRIITPRNDCFLELDFNGAEARVMMGILGHEQPAEDIHNFHQREVFRTGTTREQCKTSFFAWLYGSRSAAQSPEGKLLKTYYEKDKILDEFWDGKNVHTPLGKKIKEVDEHHALNYIVQSTTAELTLLQALKINNLLETSGALSRVCLLIHDAIIIDFAEEDELYLPAIKKLMGSTKFGNFKINISRGKNLGEMREVGS